MRDIHGRRVQRIPHEYPYSHDSICTFKSGWRRSDDVLYSDRLYEWNPDKFDACCMRIWGNFGQGFNYRKPAEIERFLQLYEENEALRLTGIEQCCNVATGYPYWAFYVREEAQDES